jgi:nucleoside phosphorylase
MGFELAAVEGMMDEIDEGFPCNRDKNGYTLGRMGVHNVVVAVMPEVGNNRAAVVATQLLNDFPSIRFGLLVGTGGGIPSEEDDIRLGDVVVSEPTATFGGVVQYDMGKVTEGGLFQRTGSLSKPPAVLSSNMHRLQAQQARLGSQIPRLLSEMLRKYPKMAGQYIYQGVNNDLLFESTYPHQRGRTCKDCDRIKLVDRDVRLDTDPQIHYGTIGSGNAVISDGIKRDQLRKDLGVLCVEMEAAGLMDDFSCLVIRGICDYADSHKNKRWQSYAAATAAAYAKELLAIIPAQDVTAASKQTLQADKANSSIALGIEDKLDQARRDRLLAALPCVDAAAFNSYDNQHERKCLQDTRVDILRLVTEWVDGTSTKCIFWLNGMAGTGKSTIAHTLARHFAGENRLGASFFFSKGSGDRGNARHFFSTIAVQMARALPLAGTHVCNAISEQPGIAQQAMFEQWNKLVLQPLRKARDRQSLSRAILFVIDALDECGNQDDIRLILRLLAVTTDLMTVKLRIFVTSRPETPIRLGFRDMPKIIYEDLVLHDVSRSVVEGDIHTFLKHELAEIRRERNLPPGWPNDQQVKLLVRKANCLFIYAATACLYIGGAPRISPQKRLSNLVLGQASDGLSTRNLDEMYLRILRESVAGDYSVAERMQMADQFRRVVGSIVVVFDALSASALSMLLFQSEAEALEIVNITLDPLHSVLSIPLDSGLPIWLLHPSFRDFLLDHDRCPDDRFWVDSKVAHSSLARSCLELMSNALKENICGLQSPGSLASDIEKHTLVSCVPPPLQYACRYWVEHLQQSDLGLCSNGEVYSFLQKHLLNWLEALSVMGRSTEGLTMLLKLEFTLTVSLPTILFRPSYLLIRSILSP